MPKFNLNWMYMIIALMLLGLYFANGNSSVNKNISYDEFQQYVRDGYVSKVIGYDDNTVEIYIKPQYVGAVFKQDSTRVGRNPMITTEAPSRENLDNFLQRRKKKHTSTVLSAMIRRKTTSAQYFGMCCLLSF